MGRIIDEFAIGHDFTAAQIVPDGVGLIGGGLEETKASAIGLIEGKEPDDQPFLTSIIIAAQQITSPLFICLVELVTSSHSTQFPNLRRIAKGRSDMVRF